MKLLTYIQRNMFFQSIKDCFPYRLFIKSTQRKHALQYCSFRKWFAYTDHKLKVVRCILQSAACQLAKVT